MYSSCCNLTNKTTYLKPNFQNQSLFKSKLFFVLALMLSTALPEKVVAASPFPPACFSLFNKVTLKHNDIELQGVPSYSTSDFHLNTDLVTDELDIEQSVFNLSPTKTGVAILDNAKSGKITEKIDYADPTLNLTGTEKRRQYLTWFAESFANWDFKYKYGGTEITNGIDCSAFIQFVFKYFDTPVNRTSGELYNSGIATDLDAAQPGDLVFFGKKHIEHVAIVTKNDKSGLWVVHSTSSRGIIKENISESPYWLNKLRNKAVNIIGSHILNTPNAAN